MLNSLFLIQKFHFIDWEHNHEKVSKLLELEHEQVKKSSPLQINQRNFQSEEHHNRYVNIPRYNDLPSEDDDDEEVFY